MQVDPPKEEPKLSTPFFGFTDNAERWNSRAAMIGLFGLFFFELVRTYIFHLYVPIQCVCGDAQLILVFFSCLCSDYPKGFPGIDRLWGWKGHQHSPITHICILCFKNSEILHHLCLVIVNVRTHFFQKTLISIWRCMLFDFATPFSRIVKNCCTCSHLLST